MPRNVAKIVQTCFEHVLWQFSRRKNLPRVPWRVGFSKIFKIIKKISKIQNWSKSFSMVSKRVLNMLWGDFSEFLCPVFHAGLFRFSWLKDMRSVFWTWKIWIRFSGLKIWGRYIEKIQEKIQKNFKFLKLSKIVPKCPNVFWGFFREEIFFPLIHEGSSLGNFSKKISKFPEGPKSCPKVSKRVLNKLWGDVFENFLPSVPCSAFQIFWT